MLRCMGVLWSLKLKGLVWHWGEPGAAETILVLGNFGGWVCSSPSGVWSCRDWPGAGVSLATVTVKLGLEHRAMGADLVLEAGLDQMCASFSFPMGRMFLSMLSCLGLGDWVTRVM